MDAAAYKEGRKSLCSWPLKSMLGIRAAAYWEEEEYVGDQSSCLLGRGRIACAAGP